jgi:hypothetical protein
MDTVYVAEMTLARLEEALQDARLLWVYAKRLEDIVLARRDDWAASGIPLARWEYGCAFGPELELCWWRRDHGGDGYDARAITAQTPPDGSAWTAWDMTDWLPDPPAPWLLVGERDEDRAGAVPTWSTARIPRYLTYPASDPTAPPERVALVAQTYRQADCVTLHRLLRVEGG